MGLSRWEGFPFSLLSHGTESAAEVYGAFRASSVRVLSKKADHPESEGMRMGPEQCGSSRGLERLGGSLSDCGPMCGICI